MGDVESQNHMQNNSGGHRLPLSHCRKVFIQRDYAQGLAVKFYPRIPSELQGKIDEYQFEKTVNELNRLYVEAEKVGVRSALETLLGCFTCYLSHLCVTHQYDKQLRRISRFLREENERIYIPRGLFITDPIERGLRVLEISLLTEPANSRPQSAQAQ